MTFATLLVSLRRTGALALALGAFGAVACSNDSTPGDDPTCDDCGPSCPDPTCLSAEVDIEVRQVWPFGTVLPHDTPVSDPSQFTLLPPFPLEIVVSFDGVAETYQFAGAQTDPDRAPEGPCTDASGEPAPASCRIEGDTTLYLKTRSTRPDVYGNTKRAVGVAIKDGEGKLLFSFGQEVLLDGRVAPGCRYVVDPAQCGYQSLRLYAPGLAPGGG